MAQSTYEQVPLDQPASPKLPQESHSPVTPTTPGFEKKTLLQRLSYAVPSKSPRSPDTPVTPATPNFEKKSLLKRMTGTYQPTKEEMEADPLERLQRQDTVRTTEIRLVELKANKTYQYLKKRIRRLKVVSRVVAACLSIAVLVPLAITMHKYFSTRDEFRTVTNESVGGRPTRRTAWANESVTWPTYMYFAIAVVSLILNTAILFSYFHSIKTANTVAMVGGYFTGGVLILNLVIWTVTTALYKQQSVVTNDRGVHNDLWGWTCSPAARLLQPVFEEQVNFDTYCDIQAVSFYIGLVQIGALVLTIVLYLFAIRRVRSKKAVRRSMTAQQEQD